MCKFLCSCTIVRRRWTLAAAMIRRTGAARSNIGGVMPGIVISVKTSSSSCSSYITSYRFWITRSMCNKGARYACMDPMGSTGTRAIGKFRAGFSFDCHTWFWAQNYQSNKVSNDMLWVDVEDILHSDVMPTNKKFSWGRCSIDELQWLHNHGINIRNASAVNSPLHAKKSSRRSLYSADFFPGREIFPWNNFSCCSGNLASASWAEHLKYIHNHIIYIAIQYIYIYVYIYIYTYTHIYIYIFIIYIYIHIHMYLYTYISHGIASFPHHPHLLWFREPGLWFQPVWSCLGASLDEANLKPSEKFSKARS